MLREHLSQKHDAASRRFELIDRHVSWLHASILGAEPGQILDLGCGPGFYTARFARLGHTCVGIDFSPASIAYAQTEAKREGLNIDYRLQNLVDSDFERGNQVVLMVFGEFNTFRPEDAREILRRIHSSLAPGGVLVLEVHHDEYVQAIGRKASTWFSANGGLFSDEPYLSLFEASWHSELRAATERYFIVPAVGGEITSYTSTTQAYSDAEYRDLLQAAGFGQVDRYASLTGEETNAQDGLFVLVAQT